MSFTINSGDNSTGPFGTGTGEGFADGTFCPPITHGVGGATPFFPTIASFICGMACCIATGPTGTFNIFVVGTVAQNQFASVSFTDNTSTLQTFNTSTATFDIATYPGFSWWHWPIANAFPFTNNNNYLMTITGEIFPSVSIVPNIVGLTLIAANAAIIAAGLTVGTVSTANAPGFIPGTVSAQSPAGNSTVTSGSSVDYTECLGPVNLGATFVPAKVFKAILVANPGNINPRVYPPSVDNIVRVPNQRIMT